MARKWFLWIVPVVGLAGCLGTEPAEHVGADEPAGQTGTVLDQVREGGALAEVVRAGETFTLTVSETTSPLYGLEVTWPAPAISDGNDEAVLVVAPTDVTPATDAVAVGPGVEITLLSAKDAETHLQPATPLWFWLPATGVTDPVSLYAIAGLHDDVWSYLPDAAIDEASGRIRGRADRLSTFRPVANQTAGVQPAVTGRLSYIGKSGRNAFCDRTLSVSPSALRDAYLAVYGTSASPEFSLVIDLTPSSSDWVYTELSLGSTPHLPVPGKPLVVNLPIWRGGSTLELDCGNDSVWNEDAYNPSRPPHGRVLFSEWHDTAAPVTTTCAGGKIPCTRHTGTVRAAWRVNFEDANDGSLSAWVMLDAVLEGVTWEVPR